MIYIACQFIQQIFKLSIIIVKVNVPKAFLSGLSAFFEMFELEGDNGRI